MAFNDKVAAGDSVVVTLEGEGILTDSPETLRAMRAEGRTGVEGPRFPCPRCGKETLEHVGPPGTRICSAVTCRRVIEPPS